MSVYIIYARADHAVAERMAAYLEAASIPAAFDIKQFSEGSGLRARVEKQMREADLVVYVMTPESSASVYCREELEHAIRLGTHIVAAIPAPLPLDFVAPSAAMAENLLLYDAASITGSGFAASMERITDLAKQAHTEKEQGAETAGPDRRWRAVLRPLNRLRAQGPIWYRRLPIIVIALLSAALLVLLAFQPPSLVLVLLLGLAIVAAAAWRFWLDMQRERAPFGTVWARSRLAWASLALLIPLSVGYTLHRQAHDGPARTIASVDAPVSAVTAGVTESGEARVAFATYDGKLYLANPDSPGAPASVQLVDGDERPVTQLHWHNAARIIAVREGEVLRWSGEGDPVTIWTGMGAPLVAMDQDQRLMIVETRPLTRQDARYEGLSQIWNQSEETRGVSFDVAMSLTGQMDNFTFAISVGDPVAGVVEAVHMQQQPILPTAIAASGSGAEAILMIGGAAGELRVCSQSFVASGVTVPAGITYFGCRANAESGSQSSVTAITLSGDRALTRHRDGSAVDWTRIGTEWRRGALPVALVTLDSPTASYVCVAFSTDGTRIVTASTENTARIWDVATGRSLATLVGHSDAVRTAAFSSDGARIVTASDDATARVWDAATGRSLTILRGPSTFAGSAVFSPDGARIFTASGDGNVRVWDATTGQNFATLAGRSEFLQGAGSSPAGTRIVTMFDNSAGVWDVETGRRIVTLTGHAGVLDSAAFSPDGTRIVTASEDDTARVWDAATGRSLATLAGHSDYVFRAAFSPDGTRIVTLSGDNTARIWDISTARTIATLTGHTSLLGSAEFSPDGSRIVTASADGTTRLWDAATGEEQLTLEQRDGGFSCAAYSPDGSRIVTASRDGVVRIWDAGTGSPSLSSTTERPQSSPGRMRLPGSDVELTAFRDHAPEMAQLPDGRIVAGGWDGRVMIVDPQAAGAMAQADPAAWIASLWAPVGDTARTMFANIPGLGSSNPWERLSSGDRAIAIDRNPRAATDVWFAVGSVIAKPRESITEPLLETDATGAPGSRSRLDIDRAVSARDRASSAFENLGLSGAVTPNESGTVTMTIGGASPTRQRQQVQDQSAEERAWNYAAETNTLRSYRDYLSKYPNGVWAADANAAIAKLSPQTNDPPAQTDDYPAQTIRPLPQTNAPRPQTSTLPQRTSAPPQQTTAAPEQTTPPATQAAASVMRRRTLGSADISPAFAIEAEVTCPAVATTAQLQGDPVLATACVVARLRQSGEYEYVDLDYIARPAQAAAGFGVSAVMRDQWALGAGKGGANLFALGWSTPVAADADATAGVTVAIVDTGIATDHPSIAGAAWLAPGYDMVSDPLMGNDGDGRDNDPADVGDRCNAEDPRETADLHGTHVAGLVAAAGAPGIKIVPVRALGRCGGKLSDINDAILWAAGVIPARDVQGAEVWNANPADIINLSFEFPVACPASLQNAVDQAVATGAVVVAAAGNGGRDAALWSPGGCNNVVSVGASDARGAPAAYSNFGSGVTLYAPGGDLSRDDNGDGVKDGVVSWGAGGARCVDALTGDARTECRHVMTAGTSNAAALATAALAILKAKNPAAPNGDLVAQLQISSRASCIPHPNPRHRAACISATGGPVSLLGRDDGTSPTSGRDGNFSTSGQQEGLANVPVAAQQTLVAFAASARGVAEEGIYAPILAEELVKPNLDVAEVFARTSVRVRQVSQETQRPEFMSRMSETLCLSCPATGPRIALVVAQIEYNGRSLPRIAKAREEGEVIADALTTLGFDVLFVRDQSKASLEAVFQQFRKKLMTAGPEAVAFTYYTGHGLAYRDTNFLLGTDAELTSEAEIEMYGVNLGTQIELFGQVGAKAVFVLDASRNTARSLRSR